MAKAKKTTTDPRSKKSLRKEVASTLNEIFTDIKQAVGDKKFDKKVKKASKVLTAGATKKAKKEATVKKADKKSKPAKAKTPKAKAPKKPAKAKAPKKDKPVKKSKDTGAAAGEATTS